MSRVRKVPKITGLMVVIALTTVVGTGGAQAADPGRRLSGIDPKTGAVECADPGHPGGDWPSLNRDLHNSRHQDQENTIGVNEAPTLIPAWTFSVAKAGGRGSLQSTPIVANGCVYVSATVFDESNGDEYPFRFDEGGTIYALNADTGELVRQTTVNGSSLGLAANGGLIYALPTGAAESGAPSGFPEPAGAHAVALDAATGRMVWASERLDDGDDSRSGAEINASPVVFTPTKKADEKESSHSMLFVPISGGGGDGARVPWYFLDAQDGTVIERFFALTQQEAADGFGGAGIWSTAAFDAATNHLYAGTADSDAYRRQHRYNNAIVKIDADPQRATFASVVDAYSGTSEHYDLDRQIDGWENNPACESDAAGTLPAGDRSQSLECLELDLDFGASPNLFVDGDGNTLVAALQKSGVFHVIDAGNMQARWTKVLSAPLFTSNLSTGAVDETDVYVKATGAAFSFESATGGTNWVTNTGVEGSYTPLTAANGVIYTTSQLGFLVAVEAATGLTLLNRPIFLDAG